MREKRLYRTPQAEENGGGSAYQVVREIHFSDLERDFRWMKDNVPCQ